MNRFRQTVKTLTVGALLLLAVFLANTVPDSLVAAGQPDAAQVDQTLSGRDLMLLRIVQMAEAGQIAAARDTLRSYLALHPRDGTMLYNLACFDIWLNENEQAMNDLESALASGYSNFRLIESDRDLSPLRDDPRFQKMVADFESQYRELFHSREVILEEGYPGSSIELLAGTPQDGPGTGPQAIATLEYSRDHLKVTVKVRDETCNDQAPLWDGGSGVLVNLIHPISPDDYESRRYFSYGISVRDGGVVATLVARHGQVLLQEDPDLLCSLVAEDGLRCYEIVIPWDRFTPYAPPLDSQMGLNIFYLGAGRDAGRAVLALMAEERLSFEPNPWRRYVPIQFLDSDRSLPVLRGRLDNRLVESTALDLQLALWSSAAGPAQCQLQITPAADGDILQRSPVLEELDLEEDLNFLNFVIPIADLPSGPFRLQVEITGPGDQNFAAVYSFTNFRPDWLGELNHRIHVLPAPQRSILNYHLFSLDQELVRRHPQDDPTLQDQKFIRLKDLIARCETTGSCLPDSGYFLGGFSAEDGTHRFCAMYLPAGFQELRDPQAVVVVPTAPNTEETLARALGSALGEHKDLIVLVPQSHGFSNLATSSSTQDTRLAITWAQELLGCGPVALVGLGAGAQAALEASLEHSAQCRKILVDIDQLDWNPEDSSPLAVTRAVKGRINQVPYTLASRYPEAGRQAALVNALQDIGFSVSPLNLPPGRQDVTWVTTWLLENF